MPRCLAYFVATILPSLLLAPASLADHGVRAGTLQFAVELDGRSIGAHTFAFHQLADDSIEVDIRIDLEVKFGPFTVFEHRHRNETAWRAGRLVRMRSETDDDGDLVNLAARALPAGLEIQSNAASTYTAPPDSLPTTYWMTSTITQSRLINSQTGELLNIEVTELGRESVPGPEGPISATRYRIDGDLEIDLWYDDTDTLVGIAFVARGSQVTYRLVERSGVNSLATALADAAARP